MNETLKTIASRYSCRAFTKQAPSAEQLRAVAAAAVAAPSAMNLQPWRVIAVTDRGLVGEMEDEGLRVLREAEDPSTYRRIQSRGGQMFYGAPCMLVIPIDPSAEFAMMDCGILAQNAALAAASLGLGSVICAMAGLAFSERKKKEFETRLGFPDGFRFGIAVLLGFPEHPGAPHQPDTAKIGFVE